ncbi:MAG: bifunctional phosphopantothenoylcysteine decarboxylase/phosphopantothenate--cysteine ligase CoaBC [bacterium]
MDRKTTLASRRIVLGITGGIAAYKSAELCRGLIGAGAEVHCVLTAAATRFVGATTFEALSGNPTATDLFAPAEPGVIEHIRLADTAELVVVAPATASFLARTAHGLADDLLGAVILATRAPLLVAPGMNVNMWQNPATQANVELLRARGVHFVGPDEGDLACRTYGTGRMAEPTRIVEAATAVLLPKDLSNRRVLVTAGATREALDPVRFLSNRSTGKMGFALARAAAGRGAEVTLVCGPSALVPPLNVTFVPVESAADMAGAVLARADDMDVVIKAAAVADWRPRDVADTKLKKADAPDRQALELCRTTDILAELGARRTGRLPVLVGFAAETGDPAAEAARKLRAKGCDLVVANDVSAPNAGFGTDTNQVVLVWPDSPPVHLALASKDEIAHQVLDAVLQLLD